jgi:hypothetical protein
MVSEVYFAGIDVAKKQHELCVIDEDSKAFHTDIENLRYT